MKSNNAALHVDGLNKLADEMYCEHKFEKLNIVLNNTDNLTIKIET